MSIPTLFPNDTARARLTDPLTSHEAADSNDNREIVEAFVFGLLETNGPLTDHELTVKYFAAEPHPEADFDSPRKRRSDLTKRGQVLATTDRRPGKTDRLVTVWTIRPKGGDAA